MEETVLLFDIDNTLTPPRKPLREPMAKILNCLSVPFHVAAGSHLELLQDQFFDPLYQFGFRKQFDAFLSNGGIHYRCDYSNGVTMEVVSTFDIREYLGEANYRFLMSVLERTQQMPEFRLPPDLKVMGDTVAYRGSMVNFVPIGRIKGYSQEYHHNRDRFIEFDRAEGYRRKVIEHLKRELSPLIEEKQLSISLGGQTSFDICIVNKDKARAVWTLLESGARRVIFFGDALFDGGNDAPIREIVERWASAAPCPLETIQVEGWQDTMTKLRKLGFVAEG
jgi:hydroxymethylpyrimidine pyrophosphatase-like HAD family hydrolase